MNRIITLSGQRMNIDHMVMIFRPAGRPMTAIATTAPGAASIGVREEPAVIMKAIEKAGAGREFIQLTSANLGVGKLLVAFRHLAAYGKNPTSGAGLVFGVNGIAPEPARETPEQIDALIELATKPFVNGQHLDT